MRGTASQRKLASVQVNSIVGMAVDQLASVQLAHLNSIAGMATGEASVTATVPGRMETTAEIPAAANNKLRRRLSTEEVPYVASKRMRTKMSRKVDPASNHMTPRRNRRSERSGLESKIDEIFARIAANSQEIAAEINRLP